MKYCTYLFVFFNIQLSHSIYAQVTSTRIEGIVKDSKTEKRIYGALIKCNGKGYAITDSIGYFSFKIPPGKYTIQAKSLGYEIDSTNISITIHDKENSIFFRLTPKPVKLKKVTIEGKRYSANANYNTYELKQGELNSIPSFLEPDVLKAVQVLPGVTITHDLSNQIYIRGGNFDETQISLDGTPLFNPNHLGGIFGIFNTDIVETAKLYPSNYPVQYGGYLSGVLDIVSKNGNRERLKGKATVGLLSSKLYAEGPLWKGSYVLSARRTYADLVYQFLGKLPYYFYDLYGKYTLPFDKYNLISVTAFFSKDVYNVFEDRTIIYNNKDVNWGNRLLNINYLHLFNNSTINFKAAYSNSLTNGDKKGFNDENVFGLPGTEYIYIDNYIKNISASLNYTLSLQGQNISTGLEFRHLLTNYSWDINETELSGLVGGNIGEIFFDFAANVFNNNDKTNIYAFYFLDNLQVSTKLNISLGYRGSYLRKLDKILTSPYFSVQYNLLNNTQITFSYGRYYQYFYTKRERVNSTIFSPFAIYFISDKGNQIPRSDNFDLGFKINNIANVFDLEINGYYKKRENISTSLEKTQSISFFNGYAAGADLLLRRTTGKIYGWISYSLLRSIKTNGENTFFANYDRTHTLKIILNYKIFEHWTLSSYWLYSTGLPYTPAIGKYLRGSYFPDPEIVDGLSENAREWELFYGAKNSVRYNDYHRLDLGITCSFLWGHKIIKPYLQILNVYRSKNAFNYDPRPTDTSFKQGTERGSEIIPTIGVTVEF